MLPEKWVGRPAVVVTIKEIAKAVGVSSGTVSRVLNYDQTLSVSEAKRQAIIETAEALNYATPRARKGAQQSPLSITMASHAEVSAHIAIVHFLAFNLEFLETAFSYLIQSLAFYLLLVSQQALEYLHIHLDQRIVLVHFPLRKRLKQHE